MNTDVERPTYPPSPFGDLDAVGLAEQVRSGSLGAHEVVEAAIARIERFNPILNAVVSTRFEEALAEVDAGLPDGPLRGVPVLIKDLGMSVAGLPSTHGSRLFADNIAERDSELVARYRRAGMVVLGTTNSPEFGLSPTTEPLLHGAARNPRNLDRSTGGSSGGAAAAVAAGFVPVAHASDGGGSIRIPAAMNGLFGLKPSRGRVTTAPTPSTLSSAASVHHAVTTSVRDSALLLDISSVWVPGSAVRLPAPAQSFVACVGTPPPRLRIGIATSHEALPTHPDTLDAVEAAGRLCASLGHTVTEIHAPYDYARVTVDTAPLMGAAFADSVQDRLLALGRDLHEDDLEPFSRRLFDKYRDLKATQLVAALRVAQQLGWQVGALFHEFDILLTPTVAVPVPPLGLLDTSVPESLYTHGSAYSSWTAVFNATGMPAMSMPLGTASDGLPIGVQFAADVGQEGLLLSLAGQIEAAAPWSRYI
jgi:amidase